MKQPIEPIEKRPALSSVGIKKDVLVRLREHVYSQPVRLFIADIVSVAVLEYLDREEAKEETA